MTLLILALMFLLCTCNGQQCINEIHGSQIPEPNLCSTFGESALDLRVINGMEISATTAPWHTIFSKKINGHLEANNIFGGGSLITSDLVLTAAHLFWTNSHDGHVCPKHARNLKSPEDCHGLKGGCPKGCNRVTVQDVELYFGTSSVNEESLLPYSIEYIELHTGYNKQSISNHIAEGHDIAIVRTTKHVIMSPTIQTVCLPNPNLEDELTSAENDVSINGFGRNSKNMVPQTLQQGCLFVVSNETCRNKYRPIAKKATILFPDGEITGDQICAGGEGVDSCNGDSGGGLIKNKEGTNIIIGITSLGSQTCNTSLPGLYTNVFSHLDWIQRQMTLNCTQWSVCNSTCSSPGYQVRHCSGVSNGRTWDKDEQQECPRPVCIDNKAGDLELKRLAVLGGWVGNYSQSNTVFVEDCPEAGSQIPDLPRNISHGVGAFLPFQMPLLVFCGGWISTTGPTRECFEYEIRFHNIMNAFFDIYSINEWKPIKKMQTPRSNAAISIIPNKQNGGFKVWITGGRSSRRTFLDSTEILEKKGDAWSVREGPSLTKRTGAHCAITVEDASLTNNAAGVVYVIGGAHFDSETKKFIMTSNVDVYQYDIEGNLEGMSPLLTLPNLTTARSGHACTLVTDGNKPVGIMVAGGQRASRRILDSVEYLPLGGKEWKELAALPRQLTGAKLVLKFGKPTLIGGTGYATEQSAQGKKFTDLTFSKDMISLENNTWNKIGEVVETVAYHEVLTMDSAICLEIQREAYREDDYEEYDNYDESAIDIRIV